MNPLDHHILDRIATWPLAAQQHLLALRAIAFEVSRQADIGPLDETLKWGQPAWRPRRPRTGSTLRVNWSPSHPGHLMAFVDCKTDLASQMSTRFPGQFRNDGTRALAFDLDGALPQHAIWQLANLTFTYHQRKAPRSAGPPRA